MPKQLFPCRAEQFSSVRPQMNTVQAGIIHEGTVQRGQVKIYLKYQCYAQRSTASTFYQTNP